MLNYNEQLGFPPQTRRPTFANRAMTTLRQIALFPCLVSGRFALQAELRPISWDCSQVIFLLPPGAAELLRYLLQEVLLVLLFVPPPHPKLVGLRSKRDYEAAGQV